MSLTGSDVECREMLKIKFGAQHEQWQVFSVCLLWLPLLFEPFPVAIASFGGGLKIVLEYHIPFVYSGFQKL